MGTDNLRIPIAIVLAGALVGAGLFFGLRGTHRDLPTARPLGAPVTMGETPKPPAQPVPSGVRPPDPPAPERATKEKVTSDVEKALEAARPAILKACWEPHVREHPKAKPFKCLINFTFGADGKQVARGVSEGRTNERSNVGLCITQTMPSLEIPPPGAGTFVEVPFLLP